MFLIVGKYRINFDDVSYYWSSDGDKETSFKMKNSVQIFYLDIPVKEVDDYYGFEIY